MSYENIGRAHIFTCTTTPHFNLDIPSEKYDNTKSTVHYPQTFSKKSVKPNVTIFKPLVRVDHCYKNSNL